MPFTILCDSFQITKCLISQFFPRFGVIFYGSQNDTIAFGGSDL